MALNQCFNPCLGFLTLTTGSLVRLTAEAKYEDFVSCDADSKPVEGLVLDDISFAFIGAGGKMSEAIESGDGDVVTRVGDNNEPLNM